MRGLLNAMSKSIGFLYHIVFKGGMIKGGGLVNIRTGLIFLTLSLGACSRKNESQQSQFSYSYTDFKKPCQVIGIARIICLNMDQISH